MDTPLPRAPLSLPLYPLPPRQPRPGLPPVAPNGPPVALLLHGFAGAPAQWLPLAPQLAPFCQPVAVGLPGHTQGPALSAPPSPEQVIQALAAIPARLGLTRPPVWVGYSMGGRLALALAAAQPQLVGGLVLESASPGLRDGAEREARAQADEELAQKLEGMAPHSLQMKAWAAEWLAQPLFGGLRELSPQQQADALSQRAGQNPAGLALALRAMGTARLPSLWDKLPQLPMATLLITGQRDTKFMAIARHMMEARQNKSAGPHWCWTAVREASHLPHLETPDSYLAALAAFLHRLPQQKSGRPL